MGGEACPAARPPARIGARQVGGPSKPAARCWRAVAGSRGNIGIVEAAPCPDGSG